MGAHIQFEINVRMIGFGFLASFFSSVNCRFRRAGYIIRNKHTPMGMDIPANCRLLIATLSSGMTCERESPVSMHKKTHRARYFSKTPRCTSVFSPKGYSPKKNRVIYCFFSVLQPRLDSLMLGSIGFRGFRMGICGLYSCFWSLPCFLTPCHINNFRYIYMFCLYKQI